MYQAYLLWYSDLHNCTRVIYGCQSPVSTSVTIDPLSTDRCCYNVRQRCKYRYRMLMNKQ